MSLESEIRDIRRELMKLKAQSENLVTINDACKILSVCKATLYDLIKRGDVKKTTIQTSKGKVVRVLRSSLSQLINENKAA